jgi:FtsP/CotA-like multicopper oxidase with cupredoxin domain
MRLLPLILLGSTLSLGGAMSAFAQQPAAEPPVGNVVLQAQGEGAQVYACADAKWTLKAPDARLLDSSGNVIGKHFAGPTWQLTDGSTVKASLVSSTPSPDAASVAWLLLKAVPGSGSGTLATVAFIRRSETRGGKAPDEACTNGDEKRVNYSAKYTFYAAP